jgi:hypothetical protein
MDEPDASGKISAGERKYIWKVNSRMSAIPAKFNLVAGIKSS